MPVYYIGKTGAFDTKTKCAFFIASVLAWCGKEERNTLHPFSFPHPSRRKKSSLELSVRRTGGRKRNPGQSARTILHSLKKIMSVPSLPPPSATSGTSFFLFFLKQQCSNMHPNVGGKHVNLSSLDLLCTVLLCCTALLGCPLVPHT